MKNVKNKYVRESLPAAVAGAVGSITNTVLYLFSVNIWAGTVDKTLSSILNVAVTIYFPIELAACIILVPIYVAVLKKISGKILSKKSKPELITAEQTDVQTGVTAEEESEGKE